MPRAASLAVVFLAACAPGPLYRVPLRREPPPARALPVGVDPDALISLHGDLPDDARIPDEELEALEEQFIDLVAGMVRAPSHAPRVPVDVFIDVHEENPFVPASVAGAVASVMLFSFLGLPIVIYAGTRSYSVRVEAEVVVADSRLPKFVHSVEVGPHSESYNLVTDVSELRRRMLTRALEELYDQIEWQVGPPLLAYLSGLRRRAD